MIGDDQTTDKVSCVEPEEFAVHIPRALHANRVWVVQARANKPLKPNRNGQSPGRLRIAGLNPVDPGKIGQGQTAAADLPQANRPTRLVGHLPAPATAPPQAATPAEEIFTAQQDLRRRLANANKRAGTGRLRPADIYSTVKRAYVAVRSWQRRDDCYQFNRMLRQDTDNSTARQSSLFLVLLRSTFPELPPQRLSKWAAALEAADHHRVLKRNLVGFLDDHGGIEGAARERARLRANAR